MTGGSFIVTNAEELTILIEIGLTSYAEYAHAKKVKMGYLTVIGLIQGEVAFCDWSRRIVRI